MSFNAKDTHAYREDAKAEHSILRPRQREELIQRYLPVEPKTEPKKGLKSFLLTQLYILSYTLIHALFSAYIRVRIAWHAVTHQIISVLRYHHRTPEYIQRDVASLKRLPKHVSVILTLDDGEGIRRLDAREKVVREVADIAAWCASAGIRLLSVYEKTGILKQDRERTHREISQKLGGWFGRYQTPGLHLHSPNDPPIFPRYYNPDQGDDPNGIAIMLISAEDGRDSMVDLTKVLTTMVQQSKILPADVTMNVIDNELVEGVMNEPDLLISFAPYVDLQGYPPWQIRLTEIYCRQDNQSVGYQVFLSALKKYASANFKLGK